MKQIAGLVKPSIVSVVVPVVALLCMRDIAVTAMEYGYSSIGMGCKLTDVGCSVQLAKPAK